MDDRASHLLLDELFATGDERFVEQLRKARDPKKLASVTERWKKDGRPWARQQVLRYLDQPMDVPGHEVVVKRLFKHAEAQRDDELLAVFLVTFDRMVRRVLKTRHRYDWQTRQAWTEEHLKSPRNAMPKLPKPPGDLLSPWLAKKRLFSYHTRYYLRRRAWRYFRHAGFTRPREYARLVATALTRYADADLARGENILDSWSLVHACFRESDALDFSGASHIHLAEGRGLKDLTAAPDFLELWRQPESATVLLDLVLQAGSRPVRTWAAQLLRSEHGTQLRQIPAERIVSLFDHPDPDIQQLGAELFGALAGLETLPLSVWVGLLGVKNPSALQIVVDLMQKHVSRGRVDVALAVRLACAEPTLVARLGFAWLRDRTLRGADDFERIAQLSRARCASIAREMAAWALRTLSDAGVYKTDDALGFFDSVLAEMRQGAWAWLVAGSPGYDDPLLWSRLLETPYDDVRLQFVSALEQRGRRLPGVRSDALGVLWAAVLLGIHRGGRKKLTALRQISDAVLNHPDDLATLLPVLAVAVRSVRPAEARAGLAAVVGVVDARPELASLVAKFFPELRIEPVEAAI